MTSQNPGVQNLRKEDWIQEMTPPVETVLEIMFTPNEASPSFVIGLFNKEFQKRMEGANAARRGSESGS